MNYYRLDEHDQKVMDRVKEITNTDYELIGDFMPYDSFIPAIEDLICAYESMVEKYEDSENDKESNYRHLTPAELIDWSDRW